MPKSKSSIIRWRWFAISLLLVAGTRELGTREVESNWRTFLSKTNSAEPQILGDGPSGAAICIIQKQGVQYLEEFVDYHLALGFSHIFLYDNSNDFETKQWWTTTATPGMRSGMTIRHWPGEAQNIPAWDHCVKRIQEERRYEWIAIIDIDEFIVLKKHHHIMELLDAVPETAGGLSLNWVFFHWNNETKYRPVPMTRRFTLKDGMDRHVKTISRASKMIDANNPHTARYYPLKSDKGDEILVYNVDTNGKVPKEALDPSQHQTAFHADGPDDVAVIHHYHEKSIEEYFSRCARGTGEQTLNSTNHHNMAYCQPHETILERIRDRDRNTHYEFDDSAWRFLLKHYPHKYSKYE